MMIDLFHANIEESSLATAIENAVFRLAYVYAIDSHRGCPIHSTGHLAWDQIRIPLARVDYQGPIVIETISHEVDWLALAGRVWQSPALSADDPAVEGLRFLRNLFSTVDERTT